MIGAEVTELIQGYTIARSLEATEIDLMHAVFPHPTLSETMNNAGAADLIVSNVEIIGANATMFTVTNWTGARTIAPGGSSSLSIVFRPTSRGLKTATLRITSNDPDTPVVEVPLSGYGI